LETNKLQHKWQGVDLQPHYIEMYNENHVKSGEPLTGNAEGNPDPS